MNIKKKACAFALGAAVLGGSAYWAWNTYDSFNTICYWKTSRRWPSGRISSRFTTLTIIHHVIR